MRPAVHAADFYLSSLCVLVAAMVMGAAMTEHQNVWIATPVLFTMAGLAASIVGVVVMRISMHGRSLFFNAFANVFAFEIICFWYSLPYWFISYVAINKPNKVPK